MGTLQTTWVDPAQCLADTVLPVASVVPPPKRDRGSERALLLSFMRILKPGIRPIGSNTAGHWQDERSHEPPAVAQSRRRLSLSHYCRSPVGQSALPSRVEKAFAGASGTVTISADAAGECQRGVRVSRFWRIKTNQNWAVKLMSESSIAAAWTSACAEREPLAITAAVRGNGINGAGLGRACGFERPFMPLAALPLAVRPSAVPPLACEFDAWRLECLAFELAASENRCG
jgi:hypothetical protein